MSKSIFITGGPATGKSRFAVSYFRGYDNVLYMKVGLTADWDILNRIQYDTEKYGVSWDIIPTVNLRPSEELGERNFVVFDNLHRYTQLVIKEMAPDGEIDELLRKDIEKRILSEIIEFREKIKENFGTVIIISVESGFTSGDNITESSVYRDILGRVNQRIANTSDEVYFSASGIQFKIKE